MKGISLINLFDLLEIYDEDYVKSVLSSFSCPNNKDVEDFLKFKAIEFSKQSLAQTHLVYMSYKDSPVLVGYFAISTKSILVDRNALSSNLKRKVSKFANFDSELKKYYMSAQLIGQLGKNFTNNYNRLISGDVLLKLACDTISEAQKVIGGKIIYLECEDIDKLKTFYSSNGFVDFGKRNLDRDEVDSLKGTYLVQMMRYSGKSAVAKQNYTEETV